jgi:hypothetical protein
LLSTHCKHSQTFQKPHVEIKICERITVLGLKRWGWESSNTVHREI